jgi:hypothetical protein
MLTAAIRRYLAVGVGEARGRIDAERDSRQRRLNDR